MSFDLSKNVVAGARLLFVSGDYRRQCDFSLAEHVHADLWQADWILSGQLDYRFPGADATVGVDEILFIPPGIRHRLVSRGGFSSRSIKFEAPFCSPHTAYVRVKLAEEFPLRYLLAGETFALGHPLPWDMSCGYVGALVRLMRPIPAQGEPPLRTDGNDPIAAARRFATENLREPLTVERMADVAQLSVAHFSRRFRATSGTSPGRWVTLQRLARAAELLRYADLTVSEIGLEAGFVDLPTFSKAFKRWKGVAPLAYRSQLVELSERK